MASYNVKNSLEKCMEETQHLSATIICNQQWITVKEQGSPVLQLHPGSKLPKGKKKFIITYSVSSSA